MVISTVQIVLLLATALKLSAFDKTHHSYRPCISFLASCWAGSCLAVAVAIAFKFPERVGVIDVLGCVAAAAGCTAAYWVNGNVAELLRMMRVIRD